MVRCPGSASERVALLQCNVEKKQDVECAGAQGGARGERGHGRAEERRQLHGGDRKDGERKRRGDWGKPHTNRIEGGRQRPSAPVESSNLTRPWRDVGEQNKRTEKKKKTEKQRGDRLVKQRYKKYIFDFLTEYQKDSNLKLKIKKSAIRYTVIHIL
ncbi:hypothetical protein NDU88_005863 [Pleurodeles waltl]|uniref:Uncharacterized protein n=1 Tax=Pleurodeles waltl TaxID=8319 RepID=A0AAV7VN43_PLEWA|nr:hypothetical protein NDU88_005863 [Pleurodeles waltl]